MTEIRLSRMDPTVKVIAVPGVQGNGIWGALLKGDLRYGAYAPFDMAITVGLPVGENNRLTLTDTGWQWWR